jgi:hypothetical protein
MKRQVAIFVETDIAQAELEFSRLELFNDEKITVTSTIQNISDISKIFTDFSQGFTIPCSPANNAIFKHFYQNDVDIQFQVPTQYSIINFQKRYNAFIEIDTVLFRRGKIQLEKANLKNGKPDSYSITFYGAGVSLKDYFNEDKLSQLDYSTLDHDYTNQEVFDRVTTDSLVTDYDVRYPLITSNRVWQFGASVPLPTANLPDWYEYPVSNINNIGDPTGEIVYTELFPAVRVASIFKLIEAKYSIDFNGIFLITDIFKKAFLWFKNKETFFFTNSAVDLVYTSTSGTLASAFDPTTNSFTRIELPVSGALQSVFHTLFIQVVQLSISPSTWFIDLYRNGVFSHARTGTTTSSAISETINPNEIVTFKIRSYSAVTIGIELTYKRTFFNNNLITSVYGYADTTATTSSFTDLAGLAPSLKISDFINGICKEFNLTIYSNTKNVFTFEPLVYWYSKGAVIDITQFTDITTIEIDRMKLYKSIEFKYQDSECLLNKYFLESPSNQDGHGYGSAKIGFDYDGGEYKFESPFENLLHNNFGNNLQVGYSLNKELASYVPKPCLLYMNIAATITGGDQLYWAGIGSTAKYVPFGQDSEILFSTGLIPLTLNFNEEISSFYLVNNPYTIFALYYRDYLVNLYNPKNRLVKVKTVLPVSLLTQLQLNDRLIIRDKRYMINEMQSDLTTGEVSFTLINDFAEVKPLVLVITPIGTGNDFRFPILFTNDVYEVSIIKNYIDVTLSSAVFTAEGYLDVNVPAHAARTIILTLKNDYNNGNVELNYIIIDQV